MTNELTIKLAEKLMPYVNDKGIYYFLLISELKYYDILSEFTTEDNCMELLSAIRHYLTEEECYSWAEEINRAYLLKYMRPIYE